MTPLPDPHCFSGGFGSAPPSTCVHPSITRHRFGLVTNRYTLTKALSRQDLRSWCPALMAPSVWNHVLKLQGLHCSSSAPVVIASVHLPWLGYGFFSLALETIRLTHWGSFSPLLLILPRKLSCLNVGLSKGGPIRSSGPSYIAPEAPVNPP